VKDLAHLLLLMVDNAALTFTESALLLFLALTVTAVILKVRLTENYSRSTIGRIVFVRWLYSALKLKSAELMKTKRLIHSFASAKHAIRNFSNDSSE